VGICEVLTLLVMNALDLAKLVKNLKIVSWLMNETFQKLVMMLKKSLVLKHKI
jgi:hypothetical protein